MNFCIFLFFYITAFYAVGASVLFYAFNICLLSTFSNTVICWIAIWLSFWRRSPCGRPSLMNTAFRFSILLKQINWLIVA